MNDLSKQSWQEIADKAACCLALGMDIVYLYADHEPPWDLAQSCEPGGSRRLDISTSVRFNGKHASGITFSWNFDIETRDANGQPGYCIDRVAIATVLAKLPAVAAAQFKAYLADCSVKIQKRGDEYQEAAHRQTGDAQMLRVLVAMA